MRKRTRALIRIAVVMLPVLVLDATTMLAKSAIAAGEWWIDNTSGDGSYLLSTVRDVWREEVVAHSGGEEGLQPGRPQA